MQQPFIVRVDRQNNNLFDGLTPEARSNRISRKYHVGHASAFEPRSTEFCFKSGILERGAVVLVLGVPVYNLADQLPLSSAWVELPILKPGEPRIDAIPECVSPDLTGNIVKINQ